MIMEEVNYFLDDFVLEYLELRSYVTGQPLFKLWTGIINGYLSRLESELARGKKTVEDSKTGLPPEEAANLIAFTLNFLDGIKLLRTALDTHNEETFNQGKGILEHTFPSLYETLYRNSIEEALAKGPSKDKGLNSLFVLRKSVARGLCSREVFEKALEQYGDRLERSFRHVRRLRREVHPDLNIQIKTEALFSIIRETDQALRQLKAMFGEESFQEMAEPLTPLQAFSDAYVDLCKLLSEKASGNESVFPILEWNCPRCGRKSPASSWACRSCKLPFPQIEHSEIVPSFDMKEGGPPPVKFVMTTHLRELFDAMEDFQDGEVEQADFVSVLNWMDENVQAGFKQHHLGKQSLKTDPTLTEELKWKLDEIDDRFKDGLDDLQAGLLAFRIWIDSGLEEDRQQAMDRCQNGVSKIYASQISAEHLSEDCEPALSGHSIVQGIG